MASQQRKTISVLSMNTIAFTACFAVWVIFAIIGIHTKELLTLNDTQFSLIGATFVSLIWMHYSFAKEHQEQDMGIAKVHAVDEYTQTHEDPDDYSAAKAAVEQAYLLEELIVKYTESKDRAKVEADDIRLRQLKAAAVDTLE